jgi:hypothetical protein
VIGAVRSVAVAALGRGPLALAPAMGQHRHSAPTRTQNPGECHLYFAEGWHLYIALTQKRRISEILENRRPLTVLTATRFRVNPDAPQIEIARQAGVSRSGGPMWSYSAWVQKQTRIADCIASGCCEGSYMEAGLILCATISAMSALMWMPARDTDKKRFVEIITKFQPTDLDPTIVSAPLLAAKGRPFREKLISNKSFYYTSDVDKSETEIIRLFPQLKKSQIRKYSYASILYEHVRCGLMHEYKLTEATDSDQLRDIFKVHGAKISYVNSDVNNASEVVRKMFFPIEWISQIAKSVARGVDVEWEKHTAGVFENFGIAAPTPWWIDAT